MVLARKTDDGLAGLVKRLDTFVAEHKSDGFQAIVIFLGDNPLQLKEEVTAFAKRVGTRRVPLTIAVDQPNGPASFKIHQDVDYTVFLYRTITVRAKHAVTGELTEARIERILADTAKILGRDG
jgi:hypothetical protein